MADAKDVSVSVERAVHDAFRDVAQRIWEQHGVRVDGVRFFWIEVSTVSSKQIRIGEVEAETRTYESPTK